ncbi:reduced coenzyme F420:NADP oxidoreductase [Arthrobacter crystallopoietes BAB-32]|uniref:Reduced coenzyme F420:NADP oxidoreductase n=1 Tax=Arthrobacter crystallopoietes BAB-32 TaxID=1246476 RepID=N1V135_9MICC|nr:NAD(P)-binding domain-containing protein [Arthrobacter crystallopoietes]EMY35050.1 reduced coenzyme F420:NADP oxidoreductase [Arthrobacter crystallopoietes BAB-32]
MTDITIIGTGNMGSALAKRAAAAGRSLQILNRTPEKAAELAGELGSGVISGGLAEPALGDIVIVALYYGPAQEVITRLRGSLTGKTVIDISNPINTDTFDSLVVEPGTSAAEELAKLAPEATFVKAFNTTFAGTLSAGSADGKPLDVFIASDSQEARKQVADFVRAAGLRPLEVGGLHHARELEGFQLLVMALQANPAYESFNWGTALKILD